MANHYVPVDPSKRLGVKLRRAADVTREALTVLTEIRDIMDESTDGVLFSTIETQFGLPTGTGQAVYNLVNGARAAVQSPATVNFINRLG